MTPGLWQILIIVVIALILFGGRGKISAFMSDLGQGIKNFKRGMEDGSDEDESKDAPKQISKNETAETSAPQKNEETKR